MSENRIQSTSTATGEYPQPAQGGWTPSFGQRVGLALGVGILGSLAPALIIALPGPIGLVLGAVTGGAAASLGALIGMNSAGPRKL